MINPLRGLQKTKQNIKQHKKTIIYYLNVFSVFNVFFCFLKDAKRIIISGGVGGGYYFLKMARKTNVKCIHNVTGRP